jgi:hypothetical protein
MVVLVLADRELPSLTPAMNSVFPHGIRKGSRADLELTVEIPEFTAAVKDKLGVDSTKQYVNPLGRPTKLVVSRSRSYLALTKPAAWNWKPCNPARS